MLIVSLVVSNVHNLSRPGKPGNSNRGAPPATEALTPIVELYAPLMEPADATSGEVPYQLDSITMKLWPLLREGRLTGDGKLLDGSYRYHDELVDINEVPRFYDGNRLSGPMGSDRGISPFALDFSFSRGTLGALFFNPAKRYAEALNITGPWSRKYVNYPFSQ